MPSPAATFNAAHLLVVGDVILDRYWYGSTARISPEAPVPVVHVEHTEERPGGAGNVALNARSLGARVMLIGISGQDEAADILERQLTGQGVRCLFARRTGFATVTKLRVLSQHQQLIRLDFEQPPDGGAGGELLRSFRGCLDEADAVVLSDYAKGSLTAAAELIDLARQAGKPVLVDPKGQDFLRYRGATIITPNQGEFEAVVGSCVDEAAIESRGRALMDELGLEALLVTRGEHGMTLIQREVQAVHLPARAREVFDVTGAGDTVIGVLASAVAAGLDLVHATGLANTAAGLVVAKLGAATVSPHELEAALHEPGTEGFGAVNEDTLAESVRAARLRGETVVMTNGCFDILHAGHVGYLAEARALGDRLIVAVNDDDSVRRLKGSERPINPLAERIAVLEALAAVDWVVPFSEDTPQRLIAKLGPDVLVKGGDYPIEAIAGAAEVKARGGRVVTLGYRAGCSSSRIIAAARAGGSVEDETT